MPYIDASYSKENDTITVVERGADGVRRNVEYPANHTFYFEDPKGKYRSVFGDTLSRYSTRKRSEFQKELKMMNKRKIFESDINPIFRCIAENYLGKPAPKLHVAFFDIEVAMQPYDYPSDHKVKIRRKE